MFFVYHIPYPKDKTNIQLGYIGVTENPEKRFSDHLKSKTIVGNGIRAYNLAFSDLIILDQFELSDDAYSLEAKLRPEWRIGWNITPGGRGYQKDKPQDVYTRAKMSSKKTGISTKPQSKDHYKKISDLQIGIKRKQVLCPFCNKLGGTGNMQRWHFAKCKNAPKIIQQINGYDCDGVITLGIYPGPNDVIITGRSFEEKPETLEFLSLRKIDAKVYFSPHRFEEKTRIKSGTHKGETIWKLFKNGIEIMAFFEDDWDQYNVIKKIIKKYALSTKLIWVNHNGLISLENKRHHENLPNLNRR
jgi:predicted GIY-YIG superfamily endonuclease